MRDINTPGQEAFEKACNILKAEGINVIAVLSLYDKDDTRFSVKYSVRENKELHVTEDHVVLDAVRELSNRWSDIAHR